VEAVPKPFPLIVKLPWRIGDADVGDIVVIAMDDDES
jgi:hypothetical protein